MLLDRHRETIINLYCNGGYSAVGIAKLFNVSHKTVQNSLKAWKIEKDKYNLFSRVYIPKEVLLNLYKSDKTQAEIAAIFSCSTGAVRRRLRQLKIIRNDANGSYFKRKNLPRSEVVRMYNDGFSCREISEILKVSMSVVYSRLKKWNIKLRNFSDCNVVRFERGLVCSRESARGKGSYYDTPHQGKKWLRSTWEIVLADYLSDNNIDWYYEYEWLILDNGIKYLPDFYIPAENKYIEVKGWKNDNSMKKFLLANKKYNIELYDETKLFGLGLLDSGGKIVSIGGLNNE